MKTVNVSISLGCGALLSAVYLFVTASPFDSLIDDCSLIRGRIASTVFVLCKKGKGSQYSIAELIPVLGSQPAGYVSH